MKLEVGKGMDEVAVAATLYVGKGMRPFPKLDRSRLVETFGSERARLLADQLDLLLQEAVAVEIDWGAGDLAAADRQMRSVMRARHPALSDDALDAIAWYATYQWR